MKVRYQARLVNARVLLCCCKLYSWSTTDIHATRLHKGQNDVAKTMRALLDRRHYELDAVADLEGDCLIHDN